jgi:hypothetical protein
MEASAVPTDPNELALLILKHATTGNYRALAALGVMAAVFAIRQWALHPKALGRFKALLWFNTDKGGVALNFLVSALGGVGNALAAKLPLSKELLLTSMVNACIAAGVFVSIKRLAGRPAAIPVAPAEPVADEAPKPADDASITTTTTTTKTEVSK